MAGYTEREVQKLIIKVMQKGHICQKDIVNMFKVQTNKSHTFWKTILNAEMSKLFSIESTIDDSKVIREL